MRDRPGMLRDSELARTIVVVATGLAAISIYAFPGFMAWDSVEQLAQARAGQLTDWHPPLMSALWSVLDRVSSGPSTMFLLQCSAFLVGLHAILRRRLSARRAAIATLVIFLSPPSVTVMAVIVKDSLMCGLLLLGVAGITSEDRRLRVASLVAFGYAAGLRYNAVAVVVPLLAWLSPWPATRGAWTRRFVGAGLGLGLVALAMLANRALTDIRTYPFHYSVAPMDIVGTLHHAEPLGDDEVRALLPGVRFVREHAIQDHAHELYDVTRWWGSLIYDKERFFDEPNTDELRGAVSSGWWRLVREHPGAYAMFRLDMTREMLGLTDGPYHVVYGANHERNMLRNTFQPERPRNIVQRWLSRRLVALGHTSLLYRPYAYAIIGIALAIVLRRDRLVIGLLLSALCYVAMLVVVAPSPDYRYVHWPIVTVMIGLAIRFLTERETSA